MRSLHLVLICAIFMVSAIILVVVYNPKSTAPPYRGAQVEPAYVSCPPDTFYPKAHVQSLNFSFVAPVEASIANPKTMAILFCYLDEPLVDKPARIVLLFASPVDVASASANIKLAEGISPVEGSLTWSGSLPKQKTQRLEATIKVRHWGTHRCNFTIKADDQHPYDLFDTIHVNPDAVIFDLSAWPNERWLTRQDGSTQIHQDQTFYDSFTTNSAVGWLKVSTKPAVGSIVTTRYVVNPLHSYKKSYLSLTVPVAFDIQKTEVVGISSSRVKQDSPTWIYQGELDANKPISVVVTAHVPVVGWGQFVGSLSGQEDDGTWRELDRKVIDGYATSSGGYLLER